MGILNVTPDSFSDGGLYTEVDAAVERARQLLEQGADIIDIGGESTRPGSAELSEQEEKRRVLPVIEKLRAKFPLARLSIDTRHPEVARAALLSGVDVVNDITGLTNPAMRKVCSEIPCGIVLMHMKGEPSTMQQNPQYHNVVSEVRSFFENQLSLAAADGIDPCRICLDPGIGFGKTVQHNLSLIRELDRLRIMERPLLMALSRKRFMGVMLGDADLPKKSPIPTIVMSVLSAERGADIHRVHDVAELKQALMLRASFL